MEKVDVSSLAERIRKFLDINSRASIHDIKLHLGCKGTELLLASGRLEGKEQVEITIEKGYLWISLKK